MKPSTREQRPQLSPEELADYFKERIYGAVTLMAVNIGLLAQRNITTEHALLTVIATIAGLWLATLFASATSYRIVHGTDMPRKDITREVIASRGLLSAAISSVIMLLIALTGLIHVQTALTTDIILTLVTLTFIILRSARVMANSWLTGIFSVGIQVVLAMLIIFIKLRSH